MASGKGSANKRKYSAEFRAVTVDASTQSLTEFPRYELLEDTHQGTSDVRGLQEAESGGPSEKPQEDECDHDVGDDPVADRLLDLLVDGLKASFKSAIKKIHESGCSEEMAEQLLLKRGLHLGTKDVVSNAVEGALAWLGEKGLDPLTDEGFKDLNELVTFTLIEMIASIRVVKPSLTVVEAMWLLLISDLSLLHASAVDKVHIGGAIQQSATESSTSTESPVKADTSEISSQSENRSSGVAAQLPEAKNPHVHEVAMEGKGTLVFLPEDLEKSLAVVGGKSGGDQKGLAVSSSQEIVRQKTLQFEKTFRSFMSKGALKAKLDSWGSIVLEKSLKSSSNSSSIVMGSTSSKVTASGGGDNSLAEGNICSSSKVSASSTIEFGPTSRTEGRETCSSEVPDSCAGISYGKSLQEYIPQDQEATILTLATQIKGLQKEIRNWKDWANEKVMQATQRLGKDRAELKILKKEKEDAENFTKEKQSMEQNTVKRLSEMEYALSAAKSQIENAQLTLRKHEDENAVLKVDVEAARLKALEASKGLQEGCQREQEAANNFQELDMMKASLHGELKALKRHEAELQHQYEQANGRNNQFEGLLNQEEMEKLRYLEGAENMRREKEQLRAQTKAEEERMRGSIESKAARRNEMIKTLKNEISQLRFLYDSSRMQELYGRFGSGFSGCLKGSEAIHGSEDFPAARAIKRLELLDNIGEGGVKPERECVMCLAEEMSVVFFPCLHQVLCSKCNSLHEKQGMNECPSCRTPIQERIAVRFADS